MGAFCAARERGGPGVAVYRWALRRVKFGLKYPELSLRRVDERRVGAARANVKTSATEFSASLVQHSAWRNADERANDLFRCRE